VLSDVSVQASLDFSVSATAGGKRAAAKVQRKALLARATVNVIERVDR
jgi:hypothetical protein